MKNIITKYSSIILLLAFSFSLIPLYGAGDCNESSCIENICEMPQEMTCCDMDEMEKESCQCPEMTDQDKTEENIPAVPVTKTLTKLVINFQSEIINDCDPIASSKVFFNFDNSSHSSVPGNKIYKKINTFLI